MRKLQWDAKTRDIIFRSLLAFAMLFGIVLLQTSFFPALDLFGAVPDITMVFVVGIAFFDGLYIGALTGIGAGMLVYFLGAFGPATPIFFYAMCGVLAGYASGHLLGRNYPSWCIYAFVACFLKLFWSVISCLIGSASPSIGAALINSILPEALGTVIMFLILYVPLQYASCLLRRKSDT